MRVDLNRLVSVRVPGDSCVSSSGAALPLELVTASRFCTGILVQRRFCSHVFPGVSTGGIDESLVRPLPVGGLFRSVHKVIALIRLMTWKL